MSAGSSEIVCDHVRYLYPNVCRSGSMCQVGWECWGVPRQVAEALGGEMLRVGVRVRVEMLRVVRERLWVDRQGWLRDVGDVGDKGVGSDDALRW